MSRVKHVVGRMLLWLWTLLSFNVFAAHAQQLRLVPATTSQSTTLRPVRSPVIPKMRDLPFFDDFAYPYLRPFSEYWEATTQATSSLTLIPFAPTVGVGILDAVAADGSLRPGTPVNSSFASDTLASAPIKIPAPDNSYYLSFMFLPGDVRASPAQEDTLALDLFSPQTGEWTTVWRANYSLKEKKVEQLFSLPDSWNWKTSETNDVDTEKGPFIWVQLPVRGGYLADGFRFRFRNSATLIPDKAIRGRDGNTARWLLDMVYFDRNRLPEDPSVPDMACITMLELPFRGFSAVPFESFRSFVEKRDVFGEDYVRFTYKNLSTIHTRASGRHIKIQLIQNSTSFEVLNGSGGFDNVAPEQEVNYNRDFTYDWSNIPLTSEFSLQYQAYLITDDSPARKPFRWNDTLRYTLHCGDYYAYDLGQSHYGIGLEGVGARNAMVAMRFEILEPITIKAVQIWFNHILDPSSRRAFRLCIWDDDGGRPGRLLIKQSVLPPDESEQGQFKEYALTTPVAVQKPVFIGWQQTSNDFMNIGFDRYAISSPAVYTRTKGTWERVSQEGSMMIRAVCGGKGTPASQLPVDSPTPVADRSALSLSLYPSPATDRVMVRCEERALKLSIWSLTGQCLRQEYTCRESIDLTGLPRGVVLMRFTRPDGSLIAVKSLLLVP